MSLVIVSAACDRFPENVNAPDIGGPLFSHNPTECTDSTKLHKHYPPALPDGPASYLMTPDNCAFIEFVYEEYFQWGGSTSDDFMSSIGQWIDYFYQTGKFSQWNNLGSHSHPIPEPNGSGAGDIIVIHEDDLDGSDYDLIRALCHEISHSLEWGTTHDTTPNNFDIGDYCYDVARGNPPPGPPPVPPPPPPGD